MILVPHLVARLSPLLAMAAILAAATLQEAPPPGHRIADTIPGTDLVLEMAWVPGGESLLGSPEDEAERDEDEGPFRRVTLEPFWIGVTEVTGEAYSLFRRRVLDSDESAAPDLGFDVDAVSRPSPPYEDPAHGMGGADRPAVGMTREAALRFAHWLSLKTGRLYRLPTEAEWERACRAGGAGPWGFDAASGTDTGHAPPPAGLAAHAWYEANGEGTLHAVSTREPNRWGIHDMHGNVAEWTSDPYDVEYYARLEDGAVSPRAGEAGRGRGVVRGGAFDDEPARLRCADRVAEPGAWKRRDPQIPKSRWWNTDSPHVGFRLVREAGEPTAEEILAYWERVLEGL